MTTNTTTRAPRLVLLLLSTTLLAIVGVGCDLAHGFGQDMERARRARV